MTNILTILGILIATPSFILALIALFKRKKTRLFFIKDKLINLQDDLLKNFDNLSIKYNGVEINDKITFIKGHILCDGDKDIIGKTNKIEISAEEILWLDFKITNSSKDLDVGFTVENGKVIVEFGLLKNGESFEFEGIISNNISLKDGELKLDFFHRIPNLSKIEEIDKSKYKSNFRTFTLSLINTVLSIIAIALITSILNDFNPNVYDSKTNKMIPYENFCPDCYGNLLKQLNADYWGGELYFYKSKKYKIRVVESKDSKKTSEKLVYFKRQKDFLFIVFLVVLVLAIISIVMTLLQLKKINQRRYFRKMEASYSSR